MDTPALTLTPRSSLPRLKVHPEVEFHPNASADALVHLPLHRYQFTLDTVTSRYRFGALPNEAHQTVGPIYNETVVQQSR